MSAAHVAIQTATGLITGSIPNSVADSRALPDLRDRLEHGEVLTVDTQTGTVLIPAHAVIWLEVVGT